MGSAHSGLPAAAGLLLRARPAGDIDRLLQQRRAVAGSAALSAYVRSSGSPPSCGENFCSDRWLHRPRRVGWPVRTVVRLWLRRIRALAITNDVMNDVSSAVT